MILVNLEVDLGGRDGHGAVNSNTRWNEHSWCADVDRTLKIDLKNLSYDLNEIYFN